MIGGRVMVWDDFDGVEFRRSPKLNDKAQTLYDSSCLREVSDCRQTLKIAPGLRCDPKTSERKKLKLSGEEINAPPRTGLRR